MAFQPASCCRRACRAGAGGVAERKTGLAGKILLAKYFAGFYTLYQRVGVAHQDRATVS